MIVAIGGSAGALDALRALLPALPITTCATLVVHLPPSHPSLLPQVLGPYTKLAVVEAVDKLPLATGTLVVAPPDYHLLVERGGTVALSRDAAIWFSRPSIDALFESVARALGRDAIGVLLTGSNDDGADGLRAIRAAGGRVAVQDPDSAFAPEMPRAALARCTPDLVADPRRIGTWLASVMEEAHV